jgi:hypothetical protein
MTSPTDLWQRVAQVIAALFGLVVIGVLAVETAKVVQDRIATTLAPILAAALGVALFVGVVYFLWHVLKDPTRRLGERTRDEIDYRFQRSRAVHELERRADAFEEEQRIRALAASARVHESASRAVTDATLRRELEELKGRSEDVVMRSQSVVVARMLARYEAAYMKLNAAENMTSAEKAQLVEQLRDLLADESPSAHAPSSKPTS